MYKKNNTQIRHDDRFLGSLLPTIGAKLTETL